MAIKWDSYCNSCAPSARSVFLSSQNKPSARTPCDWIKMCFMTARNTHHSLGELGFVNVWWTMVFVLCIFVYPPVDFAFLHRFHVDFDVRFQAPSATIHEKPNLTPHPARFLFWFDAGWIWVHFLSVFFSPFFSICPQLWVCTTTLPMRLQNVPPYLEPVAYAGGWGDPAHGRGEQSGP